MNFIQRFDGLRAAYQGRGKFWDIDVEDRTAIVEIISILQPVKDIIVLAQSNKGALVPTIVSMLTDLRMDNLNPDTPLLILDPGARQRALEVVQPVADAFGIIPPPVPIDEPLARSHHDLTAIGRAARSGMNAALSKGNRFFHLYTRAGSCKPDGCLGAYDIVTVLHPFMKYLKIMNSINATSKDYNPDTDDAWLDLHKDRIRKYFISLMVEVIIHNDNNVIDSAAAQPVAEADVPAAAKGLRGVEDSVQAASKKRVLAMKRNSYMDVNSDGDDEDQAEDPVLSPLQRATAEFSYYMTKKTASALQISLTRPEGLIHYWLNTGKRDFPVLAVVAMAQLGTPPGSGVLKNDFSTFANLVTRHRSRLDTGIVEMVLFCKLNYKLIPTLIPEISAETINDHIPIRLSDPDMQADLQEMNVDLCENESDSD